MDDRAKKLADKLYTEFSCGGWADDDYDYEGLWAKQQGKDVWTFPAHRRWLTKAQEILTFIGA